MGKSMLIGWGVGRVPGARRSACRPERVLKYSCLMLFPPQTNEIAAMSDLNFIIELSVVNVVTFFIYGIDRPLGNRSMEIRD